MSFQTEAQHSELVQRQHQVDFDLQTMEEIFDAAQGKADVPHRHDYYTVLLVGYGDGFHLIDYQTYPVTNWQVHFVSPGQIHQVRVLTRPQGWVITFSREFLAENNIPESFISNLSLFRPFGDSPPLSLDEGTYQQLIRVVTDIQHCLPGTLQYRSRALGALLQLFLIYCNNNLNLDQQQLDETHAGVCMLRDFKLSVDAHYHEWHKVSDYASDIHISAKHLSHTIRELTGKTAKTLIQDRITLEAKRLLWHTDLSVKEISYKLGFEEPLHFSGFFKKQAGLSPSYFREQKPQI